MNTFLGVACLVCSTFEVLNTLRLEHLNCAPIATGLKEQCVVKKVSVILQFLVVEVVTSPSGLPASCVLRYYTMHIKFTLDSDQENYSELSEITLFLWYTSTLSVSQQI